MTLKLPYKMTLLFNLLFPFFFYQPVAINETEIRWTEGRNLTYADFKDAVPSSSSWAATTNSAIFFTYNSDDSNNITNVDVSAAFIPDRSWMKKPVASLLAHEQLHFDITEIFARRFYQQVIKMKSATRSELTILFKKENEECDKWQEQYDQESNHGTHAVMQAKWEEKVAALLQASEPCSVQQFL